MQLYNIIQEVVEYAMMLPFNIAMLLHLIVNHSMYIAEKIMFMI